MGDGKGGWGREKRGAVITANLNLYQTKFSVTWWPLRRYKQHCVTHGHFTVYRVTSPATNVHPWD